jgi:hypothetical protein
MTGALLKFALSVLFFRVARKRAQIASIRTGRHRKRICLNCGPVKGVRHRIEAKTRLERYLISRGPIGVTHLLHAAVHASKELGLDDRLHEESLLGIRKGRVPTKQEAGVITLALFFLTGESLEVSDLFEEVRA